MVPPAFASVPIPRTLVGSVFHLSSHVLYQSPRDLMARYLNPDWQVLRDRERAAFDALQEVQLRMTGLLADRRIPAAEDLDRFDTALRYWKAARQEIDAWMTEWLASQARS